MNVFLTLGIVCLPAWSILHLYEPSEELLIWCCSPNTNFRYRLVSSYLWFTLNVCKLFFLLSCIIMFYFYSCLWHVSGIALCLLFKIKNKYRTSWPHHFASSSQCPMRVLCHTPIVVYNDLPNGKLFGTHKKFLILFCGGDFIF